MPKGGFSKEELRERAKKHIKEFGHYVIVRNMLEKFEGVRGRYQRRFKKFVETIAVENNCSMEKYENWYILRKRAQ